MGTTVIPHESFRDSLSTITREGGRAWLYPRKPHGKLYRQRTFVSIILLAIFFGGPFMRIRGHPLMLFNIIERKFIIFGVAFWPQDFFLFVLAMITFLVFIILFTVIFGRIWCGWACPQTIFMEMVFRKIEYWIEGDYQQQKNLDNAPMSLEKIRKKTLKHILFFLISFLIANTFLAYIISFDKLKLLAIDGPGEHMVGFSALVVFTGVFYAVYARFREQACLVVCPYGRLQGVLLDRNSIVIAYDYLRGEPRGPLHKKEKRELGDCIDCKQCVQVCPTGIDIRNGTQLECVNCSACVDACDHIMERNGFKKGLIRFASENNIANKTKFKITPRIIGYSAVYLILLTTVTVLLAMRPDTETTVLRAPGLMYQKLDSNRVSNIYVFQVVNKTFHPIHAEMKMEQTQGGEIKFVGNELGIVPKQGIAVGEFFIVLPVSSIEHIKTPIWLDVVSEGKIINRVKTSFLGPSND